MTDPIREAFERQWRECPARTGDSYVNNGVANLWDGFRAGWHADRADLLKQTAAGPSPATTEGLIGRRNSTGVPQ